MVFVIVKILKGKRKTGHGKLKIKIFQFRGLFYICQLWTFFV